MPPPISIHPGNSEQVIFASQQDPVFQRDRRTDDRLFHVILGHQAEPIIVNFAHEDHAIFAGSVESIAGQQGRGIELVPISGKLFFPDCPPRLRIKALNFPLVSQNDDATVVNQRRGDECSDIVSLPYMVRFRDITQS